jgi:hypothetical protein
MVLQEVKPLTGVVVRKISRAMERGYGHLKDRKLVRFQHRLDLRVFAVETSAVKTARTDTYHDERAGHGRGCFLALDDITPANLWWQ